MSVSVVRYGFGSPPFRSANRAPWKLWRKTLITLLHLALFFPWHRSNGWDGAHPLVVGYLAPQPSRSAAPNEENGHRDDRRQMFERQRVLADIAVLVNAEREPVRAQWSGVDFVLLLSTQK